jgi:transcriptional regulator with XRE-family HTH domain
MTDMEASALVQLATTKLRCNQREIAEKLNVSPTQISKWKKGEHLSEDMRDKLRALAAIGQHHADFVLRVGCVDDADKWKKVIDRLAANADEDSETGYSTYFFLDEEDVRRDLCSLTFSALDGIGLTIPAKFPSELDMEFDEEDEGAAEEYDRLLNEHPVTHTIAKLFKATSNLSGFNSAYIQYLLDDDKLELWDTDAVNIEPCLIELASTKIAIEEQLAPTQAVVRRRLSADYVRWLTIVKDRAFRAGVPLRAELLDLVYGSDEAAGHEAEAESLGFNDNRIHPDVYMNELLVGMRIIHQVLPAILAKLGIADQFELDHSKLYLRD